MRDASRRDFLKMLGAGAALSALPGIFAGDARAAGGHRLNFVFILADDYGWRDVGCYGSTFYETPNLDRLAAEGTRFTDAYAACPVCSPTRASIMSGKYPARLHLTDWIPGNRPAKMLGPDYQQFMALEEVTLAEAFKEGGYATGFVGKWHLGEEPYWPEHQGFESNQGGTHAGSPKSYFSPYQNPRLPDGPPGEYLTDRLTDEALGFLEANAQKPFLLYLSHYAVHNPKQGKKEIVEKFKAKAAKLPQSEAPQYLALDGRQVRQVQDDPTYAAMIQSLDESVGRVVKKLEQLGIADNTVVIFMSDNGGLSTSEGTPTSNVPLRAGKGWLYEGGIREPMIVKWPGVTRPGSVCPVPVTSTDFYPTMLEMAGLPPRPSQHCDGVSLAGLLREGKAPERPAIFWHYPHNSNQGGGMGGAVRAGDWKLIHFYDDNHVELYNLKDDLSEKHDLATQRPDKVKELGAMLDGFLKETRAQMPRPNPDWDPSRPEPPRRPARRKPARRPALQKNQ